MKRNWLRLLGVMLGCACGAGSALGVTLDVAMQKVIIQNGLECKILRRFDDLTDRSPTDDGRFPFEFAGTPGIKVVLERDYFVLATWSKEKDHDAFAYGFNPRDGQTAMNITIGENLHEKTDAEIAQEPGFSVFAHGYGIVAGRPVVWRRWADDQHFYSDCTLRIPATVDPDSKTYRVNVIITANTIARRQALEDSLLSLRLLPPAAVKEAAAPAPVTPTKTN